MPWTLVASPERPGSNQPQLFLCRKQALSFKEKGSIGTMYNDSIKHQAKNIVQHLPAKSHSLQLQSPRQLRRKLVLGFFATGSRGLAGVVIVESNGPMCHWKYPETWIDFSKELLPWWVKSERELRSLQLQHLVNLCKFSFSPFTTRAAKLPVLHSVPYIPQRIRYGCKDIFPRNVSLWS